MDLLDFLDLLLDLPQEVYLFFSSGHLKEKKIKYRQQLTLLNECPICLVDFLRGEKVYQHSCSNIYHIKCLDQWSEINSTCPICRKNLHHYR